MLQVFFWCKPIIKGVDDLDKTEISASAVFEKITSYKRNKPFKEGVHQFYKFVLKCKVRYTDTAVICDFPQIC